MSLSSSKSIIIPQIELNGIIVSYDHNNLTWKFEVNNVVFLVSNSKLDISLVNSYQSILKIIEGHKSEIRKHIAGQLEDYCEDLSNEKVFLINITKFNDKNHFAAAFKGGLEWKSLKITINFMDNTIINSSSDDVSYGELIGKLAKSRT